MSTPQDVALIDARKGVAMFTKVSIPVSMLIESSHGLTSKIVGLLLNMSHYVCGSCQTSHELFGNADNFNKAAYQMGLDVLGKIDSGKAV